MLTTFDFCFQASVGVDKVAAKVGFVFSKSVCHHSFAPRFVNVYSVEKKERLGFRPCGRKASVYFFRLRCG